MATTNLASGVDIRMLVRQALKQQPQPTVTVLSSLLAVQDAVHYLPDEAIEETAGFCGTTVNEVWSVASFYTNFRFTPPAAHTLEVCWGPTCHLAGAQELLSIVQEEFGIDREGETDDRSATLRYNTCLGACAQAPVVSLDHHLKGRMTPQSVRDLARSLRSGPQQ